MFIHRSPPGLVSPLLQSQAAEVIGMRASIPPLLINKPIGHVSSVLTTLALHGPAGPAHCPQLRQPPKDGLLGSRAYIHTYC